ncbi:MAG: AtpZ/AtpI family protein [Deltaproteobacteria bacterium]|nr:AtpZ/AtpI family protein [Deltaproteobacteria bacterium]MBI3077260.1 AtpZ/AtpI family protein [Deltaproteobacteria bacterium]
MSALGLEIGLSVAVGLVGGYYLDRWLGTLPWLTIVGAAFGFAAAVRFVLRAARELERDAESEDDGPDRTGS